MPREENTDQMCVHMTTCMLQQFSPSTCVGNKFVGLDCLLAFVMCIHTTQVHSLKGLFPALLTSSMSAIKGPFRDPQPHPPIFLQKS